MLFCETFTSLTVITNVFCQTWKDFPNEASQISQGSDSHDLNQIVTAYSPDSRCLVSVWVTKAVIAENARNMNETAFGDSSRYLHHSGISWTLFFHISYCFHSRGRPETSWFDRLQTLSYKVHNRLLFMKTNLYLLLKISTSEHKWIN